MKYSILVNQKAVMDSGFDLDFNDMAIFDLMKDACNGRRMKKMFFDNSTYYEFRWKWIVQQLPMLKIKTRQGINKRVQKLIDSEIIIGYPNNSAENTAFFKFGNNYELFIYSPNEGVNKTAPRVNENYQTCKQELPKRVNENLHNNTISNNKINTSIKGKSTKKFIPPTLLNVIEYFKINNQSEDLAKKAFRHYNVADWHDAKGNPVLNWKQKVTTNWFVDEKPKAKQTNLFNQQQTVSDYSLTEDETNEQF